MPSSQYETIKNKNSIKPLRQFLDTSEVKPNTAVHRFCDAKSKCKGIIAISILWYSILKQQIHTKINQQAKKAPYNQILQNPQVLVSPIENYFLRISFDGQVEPELVPTLLFMLLVR